MTDRITKEDYLGNPVIAVHVAGSVLILSEDGYDIARVRGKQWLRMQDMDKRMRQRQAEDEAKQLDWMGRDDA